MAKKRVTTPSAAAKRASLREGAMPDVKRLVKKYGRETIAWCVNQLREYEKKVKQLASLKKEADALEREIN